MIPKIIHYCWLSHDPYPEDIQACILSWQKYLPDYEFMLWNFERFDINSSIWVKQAFEAKKYAFAADYIRLYALYKYGGIYLDTDVEVLKSFDSLLHLPYFIGEELEGSYYIEAATMGAEKGCEWVGKCLEHYRDRKFNLGVGKYDIAVLPSILYKILVDNYELKIVESDIVPWENDRVINIFPVDYFSPKRYDTLELCQTKRTYSIHHFAGSWSQNKTLSEKIRHFLVNLTVRTGIFRVYSLIHRKTNV